MEYNSIYKNGKPDYFFLKLDNPLEFEVIHPYFLTTTYDKPGRGNIRNMECLYSQCIWYGKQKHGHGYSSSADVYETLLDIIYTLYRDKLTEETKREIDAINTHNNKVAISEKALLELQGLNAIEFENRFINK